MNWLYMEPYIDNKSYWLFLNVYEFKRFLYENKDVMYVITLLHLDITW